MACYPSGSLPEDENRLLPCELGKIVAVIIVSLNYKFLIYKMGIINTLSFTEKEWRELSCLSACYVQGKLDTLSHILLKLG